MASIPRATLTTMNITWKPIKVTDLKSYLLPQQYEFITKKKFHIDLFIEDIVLLFRRALARHVKPYPDDDFLPRELHAPAIHIVIEAINTYFPNFTLSDIQKQKIRQSYSILNQVMNRKLDFTIGTSTSFRQSHIAVVHPGVNHAHKVQLHKL